jgi:hypothetical protein
MKKIIGCLILTLPFVILFLVMAMDLGVYTAFLGFFGAFVIAFFTGGCFYLGNKLLGDKGELL